MRLDARPGDQGSMDNGSQPELSRVQYSVWVKSVLECAQDDHFVAKRLFHESRPVEADAMMMRQVRTGAQCSTLTLIPQRFVCVIERRVSWGGCEVSMVTRDSWTKQRILQQKSCLLRQPTPADHNEAQNNTHHTLDEVFASKALVAVNYKRADLNAIAKIAML